MSQDLLTIKPTMFSGKFGTPIVAGIATSGNSDGGPYPPGYYGSKVRQSGVPWYVFMSPLSALTDAMPGTGEIGMGRGVPLISSIMNELMQQFQPREYREYAMKMAYSNWIVRTDFKSGAAADDKQKPGLLAAWPYWARFALHQVILVLISLVVAVAAITPRKPWHVWRTKKQASQA